MKEWTSKHFVRTSMRELGHQLQLGHEGHACPQSKSRKRKLVVLHTDGIHTVSIKDCGCHERKRQPQWKEYLMMGWWPATVQQPQMAVTVELLEMYHKLTLQSKVNAYDVYWTLVRLANNVKEKEVPVSAAEQWRRPKYNKLEQYQYKEFTRCF